MLEKLGLAELKLTPTFHWAKTKEAQPFPNLDWFSDKDGFFNTQYTGQKRIGNDQHIIVAERHDNVPYVALLGTLKNYKVPIVVDTDDDVTAVRPFNPGYATYQPNSDAIAANMKLMSMADAITTSTNQLKEVHEKFNKPTFVVPNSIDLVTRSFPAKKTKKIRIGWLGSACHWENLQIIQQAVKDIIANYPEVEFIFTNLYGDIWASPPKELADRIIPTCNFNGCDKKHSGCNKSYVDFKKYAKFTNGMAIDIGLAPLQDNLFNRSKSNLRLLEYWANGSAVIASPVRPYKETVIDGKNGLLAKEKLDWYKAIERLILDEKLREKLKVEGRKTLEKDFSMENNALKLYKIYNKIINEFKPDRSSK